MKRSEFFTLAALVLSLAHPALVTAQDKPAAETKPEPAAADGIKVPAKVWSQPAQEAMEASKKNDLARAFDIASKASDKEDMDCRFLLGRMVETGLGTKENKAKAVALYQSAAEKGHEEARANWARCLESGIGVKADAEKADFLWQQAAEAGVPMAQSRMGTLELLALRRPKNETAAREWFEKAAAQGEPAALYRLSQCYQNGWGGVEKDITKAVENALKAANGGDLDAINQVGVYYQAGYGLRQDKVAAAGWFNFAADYEHPAALSNLGQCYEAGQGVKPNQETAAKLFAAAAKKNDAVGCLCLGRCFLEGRGVKKNAVYAYVNISRALALGLQGIEKQRDDAKAQLSPKQLKEAEEMLRELTATAARPAGTP